MTGEGNAEVCPVKPVKQKTNVSSRGRDRVLFNRIKIKALMKHRAKPQPVVGVCWWKCLNLAEGFHETEATVANVDANRS